MKSLLFLLASVMTAFAPTTSFTVTLVWNPNIESDIAGYVLHYGTNTGQYSDSVGTVGLNSTNCSLTNLNPGITYYFAVTALNLAGMQSKPSMEVLYYVPDGINPPPPRVPLYLQVELPIAH